MRYKGKGRGPRGAILSCEGVSVSPLLRGTLGLQGVAIAKSRSVLSPSNDKGKRRAPSGSDRDSSKNFSRGTPPSTASQTCRFCSAHLPPWRPRTAPPSTGSTLTPATTPTPVVCWTRPPAGLGRWEEGDGVFLSKPTAAPSKSVDLSAGAVRPQKPRRLRPRVQRPAGEPDSLGCRARSRHAAQLALLRAQVRRAFGQSLLKAYASPL